MKAALNPGGSLYYDPYNREIAIDPYPTYARMREESPLYYNDAHDFYAVSRFEDVQKGLMDNKTFSSAKGAILEFIKADVDMPDGVFMFADPPGHTAYRTMLSRIITPRRMNSLESMLRDLCARCLDPLVGSGGFDMIADVGSEIPMRVIGMLLGIPEQDFSSVRESADEALRTDDGKPLQLDDKMLSGEAFEEYIDWRVEHPSDDVMTELLNTEFTDAGGERRKLTRSEVLTVVNVLAGAGNETTNRLIGWCGKVLAEHPDQRRELARDFSLIPNAIEEVLRFEPPGPHVARYVTSDTEYYGQKVPAGSAILFLVAAANRDERRFADPDRFDIHRDRMPHVTFGSGIHTCIGSVLARLEGRVVLEELLKRFPSWDVDLQRAELSCTSTVRGWDTLPVTVP